MEFRPTPLGIIQRKINDIIFSGKLVENEDINFITNMQIKIKYGYHLAIYEEEVLDGLYKEIIV